MIIKTEVFRSQFPNACYFDEQHLNELPGYLIKKGLLTQDENIFSTEKPGEGNMNFVRRVITNKRSFIIKQCRPWVEKYPDIPAPVERMEVEAKYYQFIADDPFFNPYSPKILVYDPENLIIVFEDLGKGSDFTFCYERSKEINDTQLSSLLVYISHLHNIDWKDRKHQFPSNQELKQLNHEHIFIYPYKVNNGFDLDSVQPGLQELSLPIKQNTYLKQKIRNLGKKYLASGPVLIHGDYYPGSWLQVDHNVKVIDPEFAFFGYAEFDIAVMTAHFFMSGMKMEKINHILKDYLIRNDFNRDLFIGFCGVEILRRVIGLAQLPLDLTLNEKANLIDLAVEFINSPTTNQLF